MTAHNDMRERAFTVTSDSALGFPGFRQVVADHLFRDDVLIPVPDSGGPVPDRYRIKDAMHYRRGDGRIDLAEFAHDDAARVGLPSAPRFRWLDLPGAAAFTRALLDLIPLEHRHETGTFGVHAFRSFTSVVDKPHQDGFEYGITYVIDRRGEGAVSYLRAYPEGEAVLDYQLQPAEILLFRDAVFLHGATPLEGESPQRDALVIQFDAPEDLQGAASDPAR